ncbi:hypothetical protein [Blastococcus sp. SYSU DS0533]
MLSPAVGADRSSAATLATALGSSINTGTLLAMQETQSACLATGERSSIALIA